MSTEKDSVTRAVVARHNNEGIHAYRIGQWEGAKQHFEAALAASPELAEAHYNLGWTLYRLGAMRQGDTQVIEAANLAPGNKVIWDSPPDRPQRPANAAVRVLAGAWILGRLLHISHRREIFTSSDPFALLNLGVTPRK